MKIEILDEGFRPLTLPARRVLVLDDNGTPVAVAAEYQPGMICLSHCKDASFNETLKRLGIVGRVDVDHIKPNALADFRLPPS